VLQKNFKRQRGTQLATSLPISRKVRPIRPFSIACLLRSDVFSEKKSCCGGSSSVGRYARGTTTPAHLDPTTIDRRHQRATATNAFLASGRTTTTFQYLPRRFLLIFSFFFLFIEDRHNAKLWRSTEPYVHSAKPAISNDSSRNPCG
jgi:hypothetical protein